MDEVTQAILMLKRAFAIQNISLESIETNVTPYFGGRGDWESVYGVKINPRTIREVSIPPIDSFRLMSSYYDKLRYSLYPPTIVDDDDPKRFDNSETTGI